MDESTVILTLRYDLRRGFWTRVSDVMLFLVITLVEASGVAQRLVVAEVIDIFEASERVYLYKVSKDKI
jgi:hypothetical protein